VIGGRGLNPGQFFKPRAVAFDRRGGLFVIDRSGWIQRLAGDGTPEERWRLPAWDNGTPTGMTVDGDGNLWLADTHYGRILVYSPAGELLRRFGEAGDAPGQMIFPTDLALDDRGFVYVTEYGVRVRVLKFTEDGEFVDEWNHRDPETGDELLMRPMAIVWEPQRRDLLIADSCHHRLVRMATNGDILEILGREGTEAGELRYPYDLALGPEGEVYVCEYENARVQRLGPDGTFERAWGARGRAVGELWSPWGVALRPDGALVVADTENHRLQVYAQ
jgi:sugar lactone lactonase YvrE